MQPNKRMKANKLTWETLVHKGTCPLLQMSYEKTRCSHLPSERENVINHE